jgi:bacterioferritin-associated ferredoxin
MADDPLVCRCYRVHRAAILEAVAAGKLTTVEQVRDATGASAGCGTCFDDVQELLDGVVGRPTSRRAAPAISISQMRILVLGAIDRHVRPLFELNGVSVDVLGVEPERVLARLKGRSVGTTLPGILTLKWYMVKIMSDACGRKVGLIEMNIVEDDRQPPSEPS